MTSLRELQQSFVDGVLHERASGICSMIAAQGLAPERRLAIYRNNAREGFLKTLAATFPVIARLGGADWFEQTGREYMRRYPSRSGNLHYIGAHFAAFLDEHLGEGFAYFADIARLEWAYQEVLVAADQPCLDIDALAAVAPEDYEQLTFTTHPAMRLSCSTYPILAIWKANQPDSNVGQEIRLDAGASRVLLVRRDDHVELRELGAGVFAMLEAFAHGRTLGEAATAALHADPEADFSSLLLQAMQLRVLVELQVQSSAAAAYTSTWPSHL